MTRALLAIAALAIGAGDVAAHGRSVSHSRWQIDDARARVEVRLARRDLAVRGIVDPATYASGRLRLLAGATPCVVEDLAPRPSAEAWLTIAWGLACPAAPDRLENRLFLDGSGARLHFARIARSGSAGIERIFGPRDDTLWLGGVDEDARPAEQSHSVGRYLWLGMEHILSGWDHLAFLAGLLVLAASLRDVLSLATGFTVAHSVTLALSVLGIARPDQMAVEALIGFSIVLIAAENGWLLGGRGRAIPLGLLAALGVLGALGLAGVGIVSVTTLVGLMLFTACHFALLGRAQRAVRVRAGVAFGFGLVHGFGFAGILREAALPADAVVPALLGFNVGVELGQLAAIAVAWPLLRLLARDATRERLWGEVVSGALAALGTFWFVARAFG